MFAIIFHNSHLKIFASFFYLFVQKDDLKAVVDYLRTDGNVSLIGLWGRSMGAVTRFLFSLAVFLYTWTYGMHNIKIISYNIEDPKILN